MPLNPQLSRLLGRILSNEENEDQQHQHQQHYASTLPSDEKTVLELISLEREKEITKQQYYRTQHVRSSIELLNLAQEAGIPPHLIPMLFSGEPIGDELIQRAPQSHNQLSQKSQKVSVTLARPISPLRPTSPSHRRNQSMPVNPLYQQHQPSPSIAVSPSSRSFGNQQSMMGTLSSIQFINENPGKKRRRPSIDHAGYNNVKEEVERLERNHDPGNSTPRHSRRDPSHTRSKTAEINYVRPRDGSPRAEHFHEKQYSGNSTIENDDSTNNDVNLNTPKQGPNFANNILSSA